MSKSTQSTIDSEVDKMIEEMVSRFLRWELPEDFQPDAGIKYDKLGHHPNHPPIGTNLFTVTQAEAMIRYITDGLLEHKIAQEANKARIDELELWNSRGKDKITVYRFQIENRIAQLTADKE